MKRKIGRTAKNKEHSVGVHQINNHNLSCQMSIRKSQDNCVLLRSDVDSPFLPFPDEGCSSRSQIENHPLQHKDFLYYIH